MVEIELSILSRQWLDRRIPNFDALQQEVEVWETNRRQKQNWIDWRFTTSDARIKLHRLYPSIED